MFLDIERSVTKPNGFCCMTYAPMCITVRTSQRCDETTLLRQKKFAAVCRLRHKVLPHLQDAV